MNLCVALDFDGVIVDTIDLLYNVYNNTLKDHNVSGSKEEFERLNGLNIGEIVSYLINAYGILKSPKELIKSYLSKLSAMYENVGLNQGILELLCFLQEKQIPVALISGGSLYNINKTLEHHGIKDFFKLIITGDEVKHSKPSKDIYELLKCKIPSKTFIAVEDSYNGLVSAREAGIDVVVCYDKYKNKDLQINSVAHYTIYHFYDMQALICATENNSFSISKLDQGVIISIVSDEVRFSGELEKTLDKMWAEAQMQNKKLFNGHIVCFHSLETTNDPLRINVFCTDYKHFRFREYIYKRSGVKIIPIAVSGIIIDKSNCTLIGIRSNVTQYKGWVELIPSGGIQFNEYEKMNEPKEQILLELSEEVNIAKKLISNIESFCLLYDGKEEVYDIGYKIHIDNTLSTLLCSGIIKSDEYTDVQAINICELIRDLDKYKIIPTSVSLLCHIRNHFWEL